MDELIKSVLKKTHDLSYIIYHLILFQKEKVFYAEYFDETLVSRLENISKNLAHVYFNLYFAPALELSKEISLDEIIIISEDSLKNLEDDFKYVDENITPIGNYLTDIIKALSLIRKEAIRKC